MKFQDFINSSMSDKMIMEDPQAYTKTTKSPALGVIHIPFVKMMTTMKK